MNVILEKNGMVKLPQQALAQLGLYEGMLLACIVDNMEIRLIKQTDSKASEQVFFPNRAN